MGGTYYLEGAHNVICDRTGFKIKSNTAQKEWTNSLVRSKSFENRNEQDFLRSRVDDQSVSDPRSEPVADSFVEDFTIWDDGDTFWDNRVTDWFS